MANRRKVREVVEVERFTTGFLKNLFSEKGRLATVNFTKKKDGSNRTLNGKAKAFAAMVGGEPAYDAESRGQVRVADVNVYTDRNGNRVPRHTAYRTVTVDNIKWVTANGKKYVAVGNVEPKLNFVQSISHNEKTNILRVVLSGVLYLYFAVPRSLYLNFVDAENKGEFFNDSIKGLYEYERIG